MKSLVTGAAGFIGSHIVDTLINRGDEVIAIDNMSTGKVENLNPRADFRRLDISDLSMIASSFWEVDYVFHVAARARIQPSFVDPDLYFCSNAWGTRNVLMASRLAGVKRVIYSASSSAYGDTELPHVEDSKISSQALHPYGSTKRMGEMIMRDMGKSTGGPETVCLRYFNVYGPRQNTDLDGPYPTVIGLFLGLHSKGKPLTIVPDGKQRRDFTWIEDVVNANLLAMSSEKVGEGEIINIGCGKNYSIWDVARFILESDETNEELIKSKKCVFVDSRKGEVRETLADISKAKDLLGYRPRISLGEGLSRLKPVIGQ